MGGTPVQSVDFASIVERSGKIGQTNYTPRGKGARDLGNIRDPQDIEERRFLPVRCRRIVENQLLDPLVEEHGVKSENAHLSFAINGIKGGRDFFFARTHVDRTIILTDL